MVVESLKLEDGRFEAFKVWKVVWLEDLSLQHREDYFDLVQPTGVYWGMDLDRVRIPIEKPLNRGFPSMRGAVIRDPKDSACRPIGFLLHHQVHQLVERLDPR